MENLEKLQISSSVILPDSRVWQYNLVLRVSLPVQRTGYPLAVSFGYGTEEELKQAKPLKIVDSAEGIVDFFA